MLSNERLEREAESGMNRRALIDATWTLRTLIGDEVPRAGSDVDEVLEYADRAYASAAGRADHVRAGEFLERVRTAMPRVGHELTLSIGSARADALAADLESACSNAQAIAEGG